MKRENKQIFSETSRGDHKEEEPLRDEAETREAGELEQRIPAGEWKIGSFSYRCDKTSCKNEERKQ